MRRIVFAVALMFSGTVALAKDGSNGCGPGWYLFESNSLVSSWLRDMTNGFLSPAVTFGMTSGTSNCAKHSIVEQDKQSEHLVTVTLDSLRQDVAIGQGPFLEAYAETFSCDPSAQDDLGRTLQAHFADLFDGDVQPGQVVERTRNIIRSHPKLAGLCQAA